MDNIQTYIRQHIRALVSWLVVFLIIWVVFSLNLALLALCFALSFFLLSRGWGRLNFSYAALVLSAVPFAAFVLLLVSLGSVVATRNFPLSGAIPLTFIVLLITSLAIIWTGARILPSRLIDRSDIAALAFALLACLVLVIPAISRFHTLSGPAVLTFVSGNVDDSAHIEALNDRLQYNRVNMYHTTLSGQVRSRSIERGDYPTGWETANAAIIQAADRTIGIGRSSLRAYVVTKFVWFFIMTWVFVRFCLWSFRAAAKRRPTRLESTVIASLLILFIFYFIFDVFRQGFYTYIPQLMCLPFIVFALSAIRYSPDLRNFWNAFLVAAVFCMGGALTWTLLIPLLILLIIAEAVLWLKRSDKRNLREPSIYIPALPGILLYAFIGLALLVQFWTTIHPIENAGGFIAGINQLGAVARYNQNFYVIIVLGLILLFLTLTRIQFSQLRVAFTFLILLFAMALLVYCIQIFSAEQTSYYYFKTLGIFTFLAIPLAISGIALWLNRISLPQGAAFSYVLVGLTLMFIPFYVGIPAGDSPMVAYLKGKLGLPTPAATYVYNRINTADAAALGQHTFYYDPNKQLETDIANMLLKTMPPEHDCYRNARPAFDNGSKPAEIVKSIKMWCSDYSITIVTDKSDRDQLARAAKKAGMDNIHLETITIPVH